MALKFQYNKTAMQQLQRELKVRLNALPTLQAKESALRLEVKRAKAAEAEIRQRVERKRGELETALRLWPEFPGDLVSVAAVDIDVRKIAGVKTPVLRAVRFSVKPYSLFAHPAWLPAGIELLKEIVSLDIEYAVARKKTAILEFARRKTTQKVNLYEKVQIPSYQEAILKIKRFLEDEENLAKSSQKILKARIAMAEVV